MEILEWDSEFFGFKVVKIILKGDEFLEEKIRRCYLNNAKLIYGFSNNLIDVDILENYNGNLMDTKIVFKKEIIKKNINLDKNIVAYNKAHTRNEIYNLAYLSGSNSRFYLDNNFESGKFEELYRLWVDNSISGSIADKIFLYVLNQEILGFVTLKLEGKYGHIGLIAVDIKHHGKKIGTKLIKRVENYLIQNQIFCLKIPTQEANKQAVNFYKRNFFVVEEKINIYHFWNSNYNENTF